MGGVCSTMREDRKAYRVLVVQPEGKDHLYGTGLSGRTVRAAAAVHKPDTQPSAPHHTDNLKTKAPNRTGSNHLCNTLELLMMGIMVLETCWASNKICNKNHLLHLVCILFPHISTTYCCYQSQSSQQSQLLLPKVCAVNLSKTWISFKWHYFQHHNVAVHLVCRQQYSECHAKFKSVHQFQLVMSIFL